MGYRSDVAITVDKRTYNAIRLLKPQKLPKDPGVEPEEKGDHYLWFFESVKWYGGYPDVDTYVQFLDYLVEDPDQIVATVRESHVQEAKQNDLGMPYLREPYGFTRIGEDDEDYEERGDPYEYGVNYHRAITFD